MSALQTSAVTTHCWTRPGICHRLPFVPGNAKSPATGEAHTSGGMPFEEALKKLEAIVEKMESEELPLEDLLAQYQEGTRLTKICQEKLADAELKIQQLEKNAAGDLKLKPLSPGVSEVD
jgi:exodeoxyribonuclease VII small subunit